MEEKIFFDEQGITISNTKVTFPENKVFMIEDINHVKLEPGWSRLWPSLCILAGGTNLVVDLLFMPQRLSSSLIPSLFWLAIGLVWWFLQKPAYHLVLKTKTHGKVKPFKSKNLQFIKKSSIAITDLIQGTSGKA